MKLILTLGHQQLAHVEIASLGCNVQAGEAFLVLDAWVATTLQKQVDYI